MKRILLCIWVLLPVLAPYLPGEELNSLDDVCTYARQNSLDYQKALWETTKASNDIDGILELEETSFNFDTTFMEDEEEPSAGAGVTVPLLDQLSLNASLDSEENREYGMTLSPLNHSDDRVQQDLAWQKAAAAAEMTAVAAENSAISAVLNWLAVNRNAELQRELTAVRETIYRDEKVRYEAGEATLDDVRTALMDWTDAGKSLTALQNDQSSAELSLIEALNAEPGSLVLPELNNGDLEKELGALQERIDPDLADPSLSTDVLTAQIDVRSLEEELKDTWLFDPDLSLTGSVKTDALGESSWSGTLSLSFSLQDWQKEDRVELSRDLELSRLEAGQVQVEQYQALQQDLTTLENTKQSSELARLELEEASEIYDEAEFLLAQGEYSLAERDEALLELRSAEISLFSALADEYGAWRELLYYFPSY